MIPEKDDLSTAQPRQEKKKGHPRTGEVRSPFRKTLTSAYTPWRDLSRLFQSKDERRGERGAVS